ncbi:RTA1 like protein-domain-containing protein [Suillus paluster]|uniref:RTA1 like protein-domain-containing protein n=1 Tax=Suillus paluster TaxID=48578 RepID=UPI001B87B9C7|nr:RTA1 like protein-domain-containing protein [Suillus paluster]KAG1729969.1 RTA1 like protein-domain-containing protein [Suillus paluster]
MTVDPVFVTITPVSVGPYHYVPTEWICILFVVLYSISTVLHLGQAIKYRLWWMIPTAIFAGILEIMGWSARLWSSRSPKLLTPYEMQLVGTIIAPTPLVAANFIILGKVIGQLGPQFSRLTPKMYTIVFCSFDVICLIIQAIGGASAAHSAGQKTSATMGANIMLGGIAAQLFAIVVYVTLAAEFFLRLKYDAPFRYVDKLEKGQRPVSKHLLLMLHGLGFCSLCIFIRSVYRTVELANGWAGPVISTERYFDWLDGGLVTLAIYTLNVMHPGIWLKRDDSAAHASQQSIDEEASASLDLDLYCPWTLQRNGWTFTAASRQ